MKKLAFSQKEYRRRFDTVRDEAARRRIDYLLITEPPHICWISGFDPTGLFYKIQLHIDVRTGESTILTHRAEEKLARITSWVEDVIVWHHGSDPMEIAVNHARKYLSKVGGQVVGMNLQGSYLSVSDYHALRGGLGYVDVVDVTKLIDEARLHKSEPEVEALRQAARWSWEAFQAAFKTIKPGVSELDVNAAIQEEIASLGSGYPSFPTMVRSGPQTGVFHHVPSSRVIKEGDPVIVEIVGVCKRYHASCVRTVFVGKAPQEARKLYEIVKKAHEAGLSAIRLGNPIGDIDKATREIRKDYLQYIPARSGVGAGLFYPPSPTDNLLSILVGDPHLIEPGLAFTLEPSISGYMDWTIIIGNLVLITKDGYELLFDQNIDLLELG